MVADVRDLRARAAALAIHDGTPVGVGPRVAD